VVAYIVGHASRVGLLFFYLIATAFSRKQLIKKIMPVLSARVVFLMGCLLGSACVGVGLFNIITLINESGIK
jgi:hypothetical protein